MEVRPELVRTLKRTNLCMYHRENGIGELYAYVAQNDANTSALLAVPPRSIQHPDYGFSAGRGAWRFAPGRWYAVAERVKLNTVGQANGASPFASYMFVKLMSYRRS